MGSQRVEGGLLQRWFGEEGMNDMHEFGVS